MPIQAAVVHLFGSSHSRDEVDKQKGKIYYSAQQSHSTFSYNI